MHRLVITPPGHNNLLQCLIAILVAGMSACATGKHADGFYRIADYPDNRIIGKPIATLSDIQAIELDSTYCGYTILQGVLKSEKLSTWEKATEKAIGHRIGFVFNDSVIMAPNINSKLESGRFQISSPDTTLLVKIYNSICESTEK